MRSWWAFMAAGACLAGCGSDDHPSVYNGESDAPAKCDTLLVDYCGHSADCIVELGLEPSLTRDDENEACLTSARQALACAKAVSVGSTYAECISEVQTTECSAFRGVTAGNAPPLPTPCLGVIKVQN